MVADRQPLLLALVDELLAEQGRLQTPVARFATAFRCAPVYHDLVPLSKPGPGEQYAFEVDLDSCSGCKTCVVACHALNGLEDNESWRAVGLIHGSLGPSAFQQTVTSSCHHCADPACLNGCPVLAYEKDPVTGIVRHLDDQCIGCQYCVLQCPYDVPKYSERLGIVRKCDMCQQRLADGEAPACVQACPTQAISIVKVSVTRNGATPPRCDTSTFLAAAPDPSYTQPTTRYISKKPLAAGLMAADAATVRTQSAHWPLVMMLTFMPMAVGVFTVTSVPAFSPGQPTTPDPTIVAWFGGLLGLASAFLHLGQPWRAWRIFLGWRRSWLSREAMVFGLWAGFATVTTMGSVGILPVEASLPVLRLATAVTGLIGLYCSVMIYVDTPREFWRWSQTGPRFAGTALVLGLAPVAPGAAACVLAAKLAWEFASFGGPAVPAQLMRGPLRRAATLRFFLGLAGGAILVSAPGWFGFFVTMGGEMAERYLFFRAVDAPKMPGGVRG